MATWSPLLLASLLLPVGVADTAFQARLDTELLDGQLRIQALCRNTSATPATLQYELLTERQGGAGSSRNQQRGQCRLLPGQSAVVSEVTVSAMPTDAWFLRLRLLNAAGQVVAADSVRHPAGH